MLQSIATLTNASSIRKLYFQSHQSTPMVHQKSNLAFVWKFIELSFFLSFLNQYSNCNTGKLVPYEMKIIYIFNQLSIGNYLLVISSVLTRHISRALENSMGVYDFDYLI